MSRTKKFFAAFLASALLLATAAAPMASAAKPNKIGPVTIQQVDDKLKIGLSGK